MGHQGTCISVHRGRDCDSVTRKGETDGHTYNITTLHELLFATHLIVICLNIRRDKGGGKRPRIITYL